jgi:hypothetical protein
MYKKYSLANFKVFICYREVNNAKNFAEKIHDIFKIIDVYSFGAHLERKKYSEDFDEVRNEILNEVAEYFIFINFSINQLINHYKIFNYL